MAEPLEYSSLQVRGRSPDCGLGHCSLRLPPRLSPRLWGLSKLTIARDGPNQDHDHFWVRLAAPHFSIDELRPCGPGTDHKTPESRKYEKITRKNTKFPALDWTPKKQKNDRKNTKMPKFFFCSVMFSDFRGPIRDGGFGIFFALFFRFFGIQGFLWSSTRPAGLQLMRRKPIQKKHPPQQKHNLANFFGTICTNNPPLFESV